MYCPKCAEKQVVSETQFCSKCGFSTKDVKILLENDGQIENDTQLSRRQKGIRQGAKLILLSIVLYPAFVFLSALFPPNDVLVESSPSDTLFEQLGWAFLWTTFLAGLARIALALIFESRNPSAEFDSQTIKQINDNKIKNALPPTQDAPISDFGKWKITDELFEPVIVKQKTSGELR